MNYKRIGKAIEGGIPNGRRLRFSKPMFFLVLSIVFGTLVVDRHVPTKTSICTISSSEGVYVRARHHSRMFSVVRLHDGTKLQIDRPPERFDPGDSLELRTTGLLHQLIAYRNYPPDVSGWYTMDTERIDFKAFPYIAFALCLLLLYPGWPEEWRWMMTGILLVCLVGWFLVSIANNVVAALN